PARSVLDTPSLHDALPIFPRLLGRAGQHLPRVRLQEVVDDLQRLHPSVSDQIEPLVHVAVRWAERRAPLAQLSFATQRLQRLPRSEEHTSELQSRENLVCR